MNKWTLYWLDGTREIIEGEHITDAFFNAGISNGALAALDFYNHGDNHQYLWDSNKREWIKQSDRS